MSELARPSHHPLPHPNPLPEGEGVKSNSPCSEGAVNFPLPLGEGQGEGALNSPLPLGEGKGEGNQCEVYNRPPAHMIELAKKLRKHQTDAEALLWQLLRNRQIASAKFRRQHPIEGYIADFYCHEHKLVIELDGGQHFTERGIQKDKERTQRLNTLGIAVLRFDNRQALLETEAVLTQIYSVIYKSPQEVCE